MPIWLMPIWNLAHGYLIFGSCLFVIWLILLYLSHAKSASTKFFKPILHKYLDFSHAYLAHANFFQSKKRHEPSTCCIKCYLYREGIAVSGNADSKDSTVQYTSPRHMVKEDHTMQHPHLFYPWWSSCIRYVKE